MSARVLVVLLVLLAVLGGGALLYQQQEAARRPQNAATLGQPLFKALQAAEIASIRIVEPERTLTLEQKESGWVIAERDGFPADLNAVRGFVLKALELKIGQSEPIGEKDRARLNLDASGTQVQFRGAGGKALGQLVVGKKYFKREPQNPKNAPADGRFVQRPEQPGTVYIVSDPLEQASASSAAWIDRTAFKVEKIKTLQVRYPDGGGWRIERSGDNADWKLDGAQAGEKLDVGKANAASYTLSLLELADVASKDATDTGLDKPIRIDATTLAGVSYAIRVGKAEGDNYYVTFKSSSDQPLDKRLSQYVLLIPQAKLEDTLRKRGELLEKKPDAKQ
jgi:hypothetical protein